MGVFRVVTIIASILSGFTLPALAGIRVQGDQFVNDDGARVVTITEPGSEPAGGEK